METRMIGSKIASARKQINISQAQLAQRLFISPQAVGKWERGESLPDMITFNRLAEILGVDLNYFSGIQSPEIVQPAEPLAKQPAESPSGEEKKKLSWDMSHGNWIDADFSGLKNLHEKFGFSNMQRCKFIGSDLSGLHLKSNNMDSCDLSASDISNSHFQNAHLVKDLFKDSSLQEAEFSGCHIKDCDFSGANFTGAMFKSGAFVNNTITDAVWNRSSFIGMQLDDIIFNGTMEDCYFENCVFNWVKFQNATLINTFFKNNRFKWIRVRFVDCHADRITYQFLKSGKADLSGVTLL